MKSVRVPSQTDGVDATDGAGPAPINIKISKPPLKSEKKTRKLLDIIKGFENEKLRKHLLPDEIKFVDMIDEFRTQVEDK